MDNAPQKIEECEQKYAALDAELNRTYRDLASAQLSATQGWQRYESANRDRNDIRNERANDAHKSAMFLLSLDDEGINNILELARTGISSAGDGYKYDESQLKEIILSIAERRPVRDIISSKEQ